jgi:hypothetical protein
MKQIIFSINTHFTIRTTYVEFQISTTIISQRNLNSVVVLQDAALPMCYIVRKIYHQEHATELRRLPKAVLAAWGGVILRFHGVVNLYKY